MPEEHGSLIRLRTSMPREAFERFEWIAGAVGLPVERVIGMAACQALPEFERRIRAIVGPGEVAAGGLAEVGKAPASTVGEAAGRVLNEDRPTYSAVPPSQRPPGGKKKKHR